MGKIQCFLVEETGNSAIFLRRYASGSVCSGKMGFHNASVQIDQQPTKFDSEGYLETVTPPPKDDPRWPTRCECGYEFTAQDEWQCYQDELFISKNPEINNWSGTCRQMPPGAMAYISRYQTWPFYYPGDDGKVLMVMTPGGEWVIDSRANNGPKDARGWTRSGTPPLVTANPSILIGDRYHGWLRNGWLEEC
ncbi:MAG: hypothetical protein IT203_05270 [Fimbriimonadaceae bacterium]|nr:hypothetical protein [Fimbriimonadaceae bacterium]